MSLQSKNIMIEYKSMLKRREENMTGFKHQYKAAVEDRVMNSANTKSTENALQTMIDQYGLFALMLTSKGTIKDTVALDEKERLASLGRKIDNLSEVDRQSINTMADEVALLTASLIKVFGEEGKTFQKYFRQFVMVELLEHHISGKAAFVRKDGKMLDYKINRVAKYLNIDMTREEIRDFEVMYNNDVIRLNGQEYYRLEKLDKTASSKVNRIVRQ